jgi:hypothetical protein
MTDQSYLDISAAGIIVKGKTKKGKNARITGIP